MNYDEQALRFDCRGEASIGIASLPRTPRPTGVVIVVGGPQYRAGSHRQFVLLARALAQAGYPALRFDYRGMGDSTGEACTFETVDDDIACALAAFQRAAPQIERFVLWGLCDGASAALMYVLRSNDPRVAGLCLANPWLRSEATLARTQVKHYYTRRVLQREFWAKLASGGIGADALRSLARSVAQAVGGGDPATGATVDLSARAPYQHLMAAGWQGFDKPLLLLLSGEDYTAKEFLEFVASDARWRGALERPRVRRHDLADADHTFSDPSARGRVEALTLDWLGDAVTSEPRRAKVA